MNGQAEENKWVKDRERDCRIHKHGMLDSDFDPMMSKLRAEEPLDEHDLKLLLDMRKRKSTRAELWKR